MAPKWNYLLSIGNVLDCDSDLADSTLDGAVLYVEDGAIAVRGANLRWQRPQFVLDLLREAGLCYRLRLFADTYDYGVHLDIHHTHFNDALSGPGLFPGEIILARALTTWRQNLFFTTPTLVRQSVPLVASKYDLRRRLTACQTHAIDWMRALESQSGDRADVSMGIVVPHSRFVFSPTDRSFVPSTHTPRQSMILHRGVVTGSRGSGKTGIVRQLIVSPGPATLGVWPRYTCHATLIVTPDHLLDHWGVELAGVPQGVQLLSTLDDAQAWRPTLVSAVVISYTTLRRLLRTVDSFERARQLRRGTCTLTVDAVRWDRIIFDEFVEVGAESEVWETLNARFIWVLQGGTSALDERNVVSALYDTAYVPPDLLQRVCYNTLPAIYPPNRADVTLVVLDPCETQKKLHACLREGVPDDWGVYAMVDAQFVFCDSWAEVRDRGAERLASEPTMDVESTDESDASDEWTFAVTYNGRNLTIRVDNTDEEPESEDQATPSATFFSSQVDVLNTTTPLCDVCLECQCDVVSVCGHALCFTCAVNIVHTDPRCSHCRFRLGPGSMFVLHTSYTPVSHAWIRDACRGAETTTLVVGSDVPGVAYLQASLPGLPIVATCDLMGRSFFTIEHVIMLDSAAVPAALYHPSGRVRVTRLHVKFAVADVEMN